MEQNAYKEHSDRSAYTGQTGPTYVEQALRGIKQRAYGFACFQASFSHSLVESSVERTGIHNQGDFYVCKLDVFASN